MTMDNIHFKLTTQVTPELIKDFEKFISKMPADDKWSNKTKKDIAQYAEERIEWLRKRIK